MISSIDVTKNTQITGLALGVRRSDQVLDVLRQRLQQPDATPGSRLPPERALAQDLGASRRAVREALDILQTEGLIMRKPGAGTVIVGTQKTPSASDAAFIRQYTSPGELMDARYVLEPVIAEMAALHATSYDIDQLNALIQQGQNVVADYREWDKWDSAFHDAIGRATRNPILMRFFDMLTAARGQTEWGQLRKASLTAERQAAYITQHKAIVAAIEERNPQLAKKLMRQHLSAVRQALLR